MRIATANAYSTSLGELMERQNNLSTAQSQLTSGLRVNHASDDPAAAARAERARAASAHFTANQRAVDASKNSMTLTEGALGDAEELMQQVREAMVAAGNASFTDAERKGQADQIAELRKQLLAVANRTDGAGAYLFGGQGSSQPPFVDAAGGVQFRGTTGQTEVASGESLPLTIDGKVAWMQGRTGNGVFETGPVTSNGSAWIDNGSVTDPSQLTGSTYSIQFSVTGGTTTYSILQDGNPTAQTNMSFAPGQSIQIDGMATQISGGPAQGDEFQIQPSTPSANLFAVLDKTISDLRTPQRSDAQIAQSNAHNLGALDGVLGQIVSARSQVGATLSRIDGVESRIGAAKLASETDRSNAEDLDMTQAISDFSNQQTGYDAALKAYSLVQRLSLFNYLSA
jgi:flagellar hook-associated protein 3 FlgL